MNKALRTQSVVVAGLGMTGQASVRFLVRQGAQVKVWDSREHYAVPESLTVPVCLGVPEDNYFDGVDLLVISPGIAPAHPVISKAREAGVEVIGDVELFARFNKTPTIGITGSNGKTTVTLLTTHILKIAGFNVVAAGNVGLAVLDTLDMDLDVVVLELSSFQLESTTTLQLEAGCILNLSDDHLDRHRTMAAYLDAKQRLFMHCKLAAVWRGQDETRPTYPVKSTIEYGLDASDKAFGVRDGWITYQDEPVFDTARSPLVGTHNLLNIQAALALATVLGVNPKVAAQAVYQFEPAPHRCVDVATIGGVRFIDDSKATNAGATQAALQGLAATTQGRIFLIAGGDAKGADLGVLAPYIKSYVSFVFAIGKDAKQFSDMTPHARQLNSLPEAVNTAANEAVAGDIVLLSPACASFDMFDNYMHRGKVFADAVHKLEVAC